MKRYTSRQEIANAYSRGELSKRQMTEKLNELNVASNNLFEKLKGQYKKEKTEVKH